MAIGNETEVTKKEMPMMICFDDEPVRFTPDGKVSVLDAIHLLYQSDASPLIWERMKTTYPYLLQHCEDFTFNNGGLAPVIDREGWDKIWSILPEYL